jgi:ABC-type Fe2+-enterobactin transport system substrate-binding protein
LIGATRNRSSAFLCVRAASGLAFPVDKSNCQDAHLGGALFAGVSLPNRDSFTALSQGWVTTMTEQPERIVCAVATINGFAMPIRASQAPASASQLYSDDPYRQFLRLWLASVRLLHGQFFLM